MCEPKTAGALIDSTLVVVGKVIGTIVAIDRCSFVLAGRMTKVTALAAEYESVVQLVEVQTTLIVPDS